jgi:hypothetical protein
LTWFGQTLAEIPPHFEVVKLIHPARIYFRLLGFQLGYKVKHFEAGTKTRKQVAIALTGVDPDLPAVVKNWCLIGPEIVAILEPQFSNPATASSRFEVRAIGRTPSQRFSVTRYAH